MRLGRALAELMPDEPEVHGLLAMMLLHDARRAGALPRRRPRPARRPGPLAVGRRADRRRAGARSTAPWRCAAAAPYVVQAAIASLHADEPRDLAPDRRPLRRAGPPHRLAGRRAEPGRRGRRGRRPAGGARHHRRARPRATTTTCTRPGASCCAGWAAPTEAARRLPRCAGAGRTTTPSGACSSAGWRSSAPRACYAFTALAPRRQRAAARLPARLHRHVADVGAGAAGARAPARRARPDAARPRGRAGARRASSAARSSPTRSSARWTRRASRPRTSSATRWAASSRCSSPRAGARGRSWRSRRPAAGPRATTRARSCSPLQAAMHEQAKAAAPHAERDRRVGRRAGAARRSSSRRTSSTSRPSCSPTRCSASRAARAPSR